MEVINKTVGNYQIKKWVLSTLGEQVKLTQAEIVEYCSSAKWGSKPTILKIIRKLLEDNLIEEHRENSKKGSKGGQPRKYYIKLLESQKGKNVTKSNIQVRELLVSDFQLRRLLDQSKKTRDSDQREEFWRKNKNIFGVAVNFYSFKTESPIILFPHYLWKLSLVTSDNFKAKKLAKKSFLSIGFTRSLEEDKFAIFDFEVEKKTLTVYGCSFAIISEPDKVSHDNISICLILKHQWNENKKLDSIPEEVCGWFRTIRDLIRKDKDITIISEEMDKIRGIIEEL